VQIPDPPSFDGIPFDLARSDASSLAGTCAVLLLVTLGGVAMRRHAGHGPSGWPGGATRCRIDHRLERYAVVGASGPSVSPAIARRPRVADYHGSMASVLATRPRVVHHAPRPFLPPTSMCAARFRGIRDA
jgi:hypothetical protein